ncbi:hypothetical protein BAC2_00710 [uncultured bacterium]|nr:DUF4255 domain-containing protein [Sandaracinaceae bacterium]CAG1769959.1 hypothetical protein BAC2_00710 [uncultured bacterium]
MSRFTAIRAASMALKALLERHITDTADPHVGGVEISLSSPRELRSDTPTTAVSLWLYQVERNAELLNQPRRRTESDTELHRPFPLNLLYLVTPLAQQTLREHALMGRILQVFHSSPIVDPRSLLDPADLAELFALRISFQPLSLEELTRVWDALKEPYQLSASYLIQLVQIDSLLEADRVSPVIHSDLRVGVAESA